MPIPHVKRAAKHSASVPSRYPLHAGISDGSQAILECRRAKADNHATGIPAVP